MAACTWRLTGERPRVTVPFGGTLEQVDVIEQGGGESGCTFLIVCGNVAEDIGQIV
jgi:hypothetical protein